MSNKRSSIGARKAKTESKRELSDSDRLSILLKRQEAQGSLGEADLVELIDLQHRSQVSAPTFIERAKESRGFLSFWYLKVPLKVLNVESIGQSQRFINDNLRAMRSPQCPLCSKGIMMHNLSEAPVGGKVLWFCSNDVGCSYSILAEPSTGLLGMSGIEKALSKSVSILGVEKWNSLTQEDKDMLVREHLFKAVLYRAFSIPLAVMVLVQSYMNLWLSLFLVIGLLLLSLLLSLKWGYRAWQVKTGNLFKQDGLFLEWIKTAPKYYSVDWVDAQVEEK